MSDSTNDSGLTPAKAIAEQNPVRLPNESAAYREARNALLVAEIELKRQTERVNVLRRALPPGGEVPQGYVFHGPQGEVPFEALFGNHDTLLVYSFMYGPERKRPCPMCTALLNAWEGNANDLKQRAALAIVGRSPIERILALAIDRGWKDLPFYSDSTGDYTRAYVDPEDDDMPAYSVFTRRDGTIRHFWSGEMFAVPPDPGQDPRGAPELVPLWNLLDTTPEGRGTDWYPKLEY